MRKRSLCLRRLATSAWRSVGITPQLSLKRMQSQSLAETHRAKPTTLKREAAASSIVIPCVSGTMILNDTVTEQSEPEHEDDVDEAIDEEIQLQIPERFNFCSPLTSIVCQFHQRTAQSNRHPKTSYCSGHAHRPSLPEAVSADGISFVLEV